MDEPDHAVKISTRSWDDGTWYPTGQGHCFLSAKFDCHHHNL